MDMNTVLRVLQIVIYIVLGGLAIWFNQNAKLKTKVAEFINTAEEIYSDTTKAGGQKFEWVVNALYGLLPAAMQVIIPRSMVETIVQNVFDQMKEFAKKTLDNEAGKLSKTEVVAIDKKE